MKESVRISEFDNAIEDFYKVVRFHDEHVIGIFCLAYMYKKKGNLDKMQELLKRAKELLKKESVQKTFGKYLDWNEEVINFYRSWEKKN